MDFRLANETDIDKIGALIENAIVEISVVYAIQITRIRELQSRLSST